MTYPKGYTPPIKSRDGTYPTGYTPPIKSPDGTYPAGYIPPIEIYYYEDGNVLSNVIDPMSTRLGNGEALLWNIAAETKGIIRKKTLKTLAVTNYRLLRIDEEYNTVLGFILLRDLDDVIVMNTHRVSDSVGYALYTGRYMSMAGPRFSSGTSKTIGDIVFIVNGQKITWGGIPDPTGLKNFIKSIKKTMYDPLTKLQTKSPRGGIPCPGCGLQNPKTLKFCNNCGKNLASVCSKCGASNRLNSSFCGKCGFSLQ